MSHDLVLEWSNLNIKLMVDKKNKRLKKLLQMSYFTQKNKKFTNI